MKLSCKTMVLFCSLVKKYKINHAVFLRQKYCNLLLLQYLREMSQEDTLNKLLDYTSIKLAFQKLFYRHWGSSGMGLWGHEIDNPGLKFRLGLVNDLAGEMPNLT